MESCKCQKCQTDIGSKPFISVHYLYMYHWEKNLLYIYICISYNLVHVQHLADIKYLFSILFVNRITHKCMRCTLSSQITKHRETMSLKNNYILAVDCLDAGSTVQEDTFFRLI